MKIKKEHKDAIRILFLGTVSELGASVKRKLIKDYGLCEENFVEAEFTRFGNGEGKARLKQSVRSKRVFTVTDVCNYSLTYNAYGVEHRVMPDEHLADLKRAISSACGNAQEITVIETILYQGRQHRRNGRESLDCAVHLQELESMDVHTITTFDAHSEEVRQAIPLTPFDNIIPTSALLNEFIKREEIEFDNLLAISPDEGAMGRTRFYSSMLGCDIGLFYKRRDFSKVDEHGKNPIAEHAYLGKEIKNGEYLIVDDMISSGGSIIEILKKLKQRKPVKVWVMVTFALFTESVEMFDDAYEKGLLTKVYSTNLTYVPEHIRKKPWFELVDCTDLLAECLMTYASFASMKPLMNGRKELYDNINKYKEKNKKGA